MTHPRTPATYDFYAPIHKGLRLALGSFLVRLGAADFDDSVETARLFAGVRRQLELGAIHLADEDTVIHPAIESRAPGATAALVHDHEAHRREFAGIEALLACVEAAPIGARQAPGRALYLRFAQFVARDFAHMHVEETVTLPLLQALFTDGELRAIEGEIVGMLPPHDLKDFIAIMLPAMNPRQRLAFLADVRRAAPPDVFATVASATRAALAHGDWQRLEAELKEAA